MNISIYDKQVSLLLEVLPIFMKNNEFALKGGSALNLFYLEMPRLSVDIDLCYLPLEDRKSTIAHIHDALKRSSQEIEKTFKFRARPSKPLDGKNEAKIFIENSEVQIKIEPNYILRGSLLSPISRTISAPVKEMYKMEVNCQCLALSELYGSKICAALDRQHPRDLFDIKLFFEKFNWSREVIDSFLFYLISHNRPFHELLKPNLLPIQETFNHEFSGMTKIPVDCLELEKTRIRLVHEINSQLSNSDKNLLLSIAKGRPDWSKSSTPRIQDWPSIKWKLLNIDKMDPIKRTEYATILEKMFL